MHPGRLDRPTKARRVHDYLRAHAGEWLGHDDIARACETTCVSTRLSEVRRQVPEGWRLETRRTGDRWYSRIVPTLVALTCSPESRDAARPDPWADAWREEP
jgi:hypothetical protein